MKNRIYRNVLLKRGLLFKKVFVEVSQNSQENACARDHFLK